MLARAVSKYNRIAPKKARLLTRPLKGRTVAEAYAILGATNKKVSRLLYMVLRSAFDNARKKNQAVDETQVYISKIAADSGPTLKRYRAASMGRASTIRKRTTHLTIHLDLRELSVKKFTASTRTAKKRAIFKKKSAGPRRAAAVKGKI